MAEAINRYGRQELIEGWDQSKIQNYKVAIVGTGHISNFLAASLAALGVGDIRIYDDSRADYQKTGKDYKNREFLLSSLSEGRSKVEALEKKLSKINPLVDIYGVHMELDPITEDFIEKPDLIVSTVNDYSTSDRYRKFAEKNKLPIYFCQGDATGSVFSNDFSKLQDYSDHEQDGNTSEVIAGILCGEVLQKMLGKTSVDSFSYSPSGKRFNLEDKLKIRFADLNNKTALVVGAGALGNFLGIGLAHAGIGKLYLVDDDEIETTNLNRQILFYDMVGQKKADSLAKRLMEINPEMEVIPINERVSETFESKIRKLKPNVLIDCVDNLATRAILNHFAVRYKIPLISGGTDYKAGQVVVYEPGKSSCLNCKLNVDAALVEARQSHSCIHAPTPSVVVTNHIVGALMAAEARCVLDSENYGDATRKTIKYDSTKTARLGLIGQENSCECQRKTTCGSWVNKLMSDKENSLKDEKKENEK